MASQLQDILKQVALNAVEGSLPGGGDQDEQESDSGGWSGGKGLAVGVGSAILVPLAMRNLANLAKRLGVDSLEDLSSPGEAVSRLTSSLGDSVGSELGDKLTGKLDEAGGPAGLLKDAVTGALPFGGGGGGGGKGGVAGVGKGRRMPVQQSVDIGLPIETVYNQWTQFEDWPTFMHRVTRVTQEDSCTLSFETKIWTRKREFKAEIETQRPNERIKWKVSQGLTHTGVVSFHELGPNLTRVLVGFDVQPGGMIEKAARGMRHVKRGARADLHRFKAFIEMAEHESGAWRGVIEDGEVIEEHDPSYDEQREYSDPEELVLDNKDDDEEQDEQEDGKDREQNEQGGRGSRPSSEGAGRRSRGTSRTGGSSRSRGARNGDESSAGSGSTGRSKSSKRQGESPRSKRSSSGSGSRGSSSQGRSRSGQSRGGSSASGSGSRGGSGRRTARRQSSNDRQS